jgi:hypothetical protein
VIPKRLTWMAVGGVVALAVKARTERAVTAEARHLQERLPDPAVRLLERLPGELTRTGGAAVVGLRAARVGGRAGYRAAVVSGRTSATATSAAAAAGRVTARAGTVAGDAARRVRDDLTGARVAWEQAAEGEERLLRSDLARLAGDPVEAVDALVDRRGPAADGPVPEVPPPIPAGRPRSTHPDPTVASRRRRGYRPPNWARPPGR